MANRIGERYRCSDPGCGCEVEIVRPVGGIEEDRRVTDGGSTLRSSTLSTPPSAVSVPRQSPGISEGAGERNTPYGSPKISEGAERGAFHDEEEKEGPETVSTAVGSGLEPGMEIGSLICFCGNAMTLAGGRSRSASAGGTD